MQNIRLQALINLLLLVLLLCFTKICSNNPNFNSASHLLKPDTVYIPKPYKVLKIEKQYIEKPVKVYVYLKDTSLRKQAEQNTIITDIQLKSKGLFKNMDMLKITKIDTAGLIYTDEFKIPPFKSLNIDGQGFLEIKPKRFQGLKKGFKIGTSLVITIGASFFLYQILK